MKILITSDYYSPEINGVVTSIINLKKGLERDGHEVRVLTLSNGHRECQIGDTYYIGSFSAGVIYPNARIAIPKNCKFIADLLAWKPDIIHSQCEFSTFVFARYIAKISGAPIVHTYHTVYEGYTHYFCPSKALGKKAVERFTRRVSRYTKTIIVPTQKMYDMLRGYDIKTPIAVIPSGINLEKYEISRQLTKFERYVTRKRCGVSEDDCLLIYLGRLAKEKNVSEIISFLAVNRNRKIKLMIVGDGPDRKELEEKIRRENLGNQVFFTGMVPPEKVVNFYRTGDVFVSASTSETQGLTYMEAMASGLPILCKYDRCLEGVIENEENGYIYNTMEEFYLYLSRLASDRDLRLVVGTKAMETIHEKYSTDSFVKACESLYQGCLN